jgi:hypothetical protein
MTVRLNNRYRPSKTGFRPRLFAGKYLQQNDCKISTTCPNLSKRGFLPLVICSHEFMYGRLNYKDDRYDSYQKLELIDPVQPTEMGF